MHFGCCLMCPTDSCPECRCSPSGRARSRIRRVYNKRRLLPSAGERAFSVAERFFAQVRVCHELNLCSICDMLLAGLLSHEQCVDPAMHAQQQRVSSLCLGTLATNHLGATRYMRLERPSHMAASPPKTSDGMTSELSLWVTTGRFHG